MGKHFKKVHPINEESNMVDQVLATGSDITPEMSPIKHPLKSIKTRNDEFDIENSTPSLVD